MFDNFLNFLDDSENIQYRRNFAGLQVAGQITGIDAQGRYIFGTLPNGQTVDERYEADRFLNVSSSVWRIKIGASYEF